MKIIIETIPHSTHRYPTVGDWYHDTDGVLHIKVSQMENWRAEALVAVHELIEAILCKHDHVSEEVIDFFDKEFEKARVQGDHSEPGDDPKAPYVNQHCFATGVERSLASVMGVSWSDYEKKINDL